MTEGQPSWASVTDDGPPEKFLAALTKLELQRRITGAGLLSSRGYRDPISQSELLWHLAVYEAQGRCYATVLRYSGDLGEWQDWALDGGPVP